MPFSLKFCCLEIFLQRELGLVVMELKPGGGWLSSSLVLTTSGADQTVDTAEAAGAIVTSICMKMNTHLKHGLQLFSFILQFPFFFSSLLISRFVL